MKENPSVSTYLRSLNIIYLAQVGMLLAFSLVVFFLNSAGSIPANKEMASVLQYPLIIVFIGCLAAGRFVPYRLINQIDPSRELSYKISKYVGVVIIRGACLEVPGIFACVVSFLSGRSYYLLVIPFLLIIFLLYRPSTSSIANELNLSADERHQL